MASMLSSDPDNSWLLILNAPAIRPARPFDPLDCGDSIGKNLGGDRLRFWSRAQPLVRHEET